MIQTSTSFDECMQKSSVILVKSTSLYIADQYAAIYENSIVHDLREMPCGWQEKSAIYKKLQNSVVFSRHNNQKHFIVTLHQLPAAIHNMLDIVIRHEDGYATFDYEVVRHHIYEAETPNSRNTTTDNP